MRPLREVVGYGEATDAKQLISRIAGSKRCEAETEAPAPNMQSLFEVVLIAPITECQIEGDNVIFSRRVIAWNGDDATAKVGVRSKRVV